MSASDLPTDVDSPTADAPDQSDSTSEANSAGDESITRAAQERDEYRDKLLRSHAELENYRKRVQRERDEDRRYAAVPLARDLLPTLDNLQRAIEAAEKGGTVEDLKQGVAMVLQQARETLAKHQIVPIPAAGEAFDPNQHEALTQIPSSDHPPMTVVQEVETGYKLHDRVLRPTKVIVSAPAVSEGNK